MSGTVSKNGGRASGIVGAGAIGADAVGSSNIADDAIDSEHYTDASIDNAHLADDAVDSDELAAGSIDTAHIADNQITLAKMAGGTDGNIISYDASGDPVAIATGSDGEVLTSTGAGSPPAFEAAAGGGAWTKIGTAVASDSASLTITGLDSTYDTYAIACSDLMPVTDNAYAWFRIGDSGGILDGSTDYAYHFALHGSNTGAYQSIYSTGASKFILSWGIGNATAAPAEGSSSMIYLHGPADSTGSPRISVSGAFVSDTGNHYAPSGGGHYKAAVTMDRIQFMYSTGNIVSGRLTVWGISHA